jgi:hypothetical protein
MRPTIFLSLVLLSLANFLKAQSDTITVMHYNLLHYGNTTTYCTQTNNNIINKAQNMAMIMNHVKPHILTVNEMGANSFAPNHFLDNALNVNNINYYQGGTLSNVSGDNIANFLYYDARKFVLYQEHVLATDIRDINIYTLYYNDPDLWKHHDTTFLVVLTTHLKAGNSSSDRAMRAATTSMLMDSAVLWNGLPAIFSGDFNFYTASEQGYKNLTQPTDTTGERFHDPIQQEGAWHDSQLFAPYHTQSTHASSNGCAASGGLDDRFDFILINEILKYHSSRFAYLPNSYHAPGNDGNHLNQSINFGTNTSEPPNIVQALYDASDHLPVVMQLVVNTPVGIREMHKQNSFTSITCKNHRLRVVLPAPAALECLEVYDVTGRRVTRFLPGDDISRQFDFVIPQNTPTNLLIIHAVDHNNQWYRGKVMMH